jgi:hypothetical protein
LVLKRRLFTSPILDVAPVMKAAFPSSFFHDFLLTRLLFRHKGHRGVIATESKLTDSAMKIIRLDLNYKVRTLSFDEATMLGSS